MSDIYASLAAVMADVDHVAKRDRNEAQRFLFRGIDSVVNAVGPVLRKHHVISIPDVESVTYEDVKTSTGKSTTACRVIVRYTFYALDGSSVSARVPGEAWDSGDKATPKAMSVAERTALIQALCLPTDESDPDADTYERTGAKSRTKAAPAEPEPPAPTRTMSRATRTPTPAPEVDYAAVEEGDYVPATVPEPDAVTPAQITKIGTAMSKAKMTDRTVALAYVARVIGRTVKSRNELSKAEAHQVIEALEFDAMPPEPEATS